MSGAAPTKLMIAENFAHGRIQFPNVNSMMLGKVIKYYKKHVKAASFSEAIEDARSLDDALKSWDGCQSGSTVNETKQNPDTENDENVLIEVVLPFVRFTRSFAESR